MFYMLYKIIYLIYENYKNVAVCCRRTTIYIIPKMYFFVHRHIFAIKELWLYVAHSMSKSPAINLKYGIKNF